MKLTMDFCDKTLEDTNLTARNLEEKVKANTTNAAFLKLKDETKVQENKVKLQLQRKKTQKLNNLRYGIKPEVQNQRKHNPKINSTEQKQQGRLEPVRNKSATKNNQNNNTYASILTKGFQKPSVYNSEPKKTPTN